MTTALGIYAIGFVVAFTLSAREAPRNYDTEDVLLLSIFVAAIWPAVAAGMLVTALFRLARLGAW